MESAQSNSDPELQALQNKWSPDWSIWRARRIEDPPGAASGEFVATRMREAAGEDPTIMLPSAQQLDKALDRQRDLPDNGW